MSVTASSVASVPSETAGFQGAYRRGDEVACRFLPRHPSREEDWEGRIEELGGRAPAVAVWERAARAAAALGGDEAAQKAASLLGAGEALCVTTGQQPGLFLGPLYTIYKAVTVIALARRVERLSEKRTVPVFWIAADDSDFGEVGTAIVPRSDLALERFALDGGELAAGGMVGDLATTGTADALSRTHWDEHVAGEAVRECVSRALDRASDHGELTAALLHDLFAGTGLVIVDGRWPELRTAAAGLFERWAERRTEASESVRSSGRDLERAGFRAPIRDESTVNGLFDISSGRRLPFDGDDAVLLERILGSAHTLSPNVMLRPLVQDSLFPNVATVGGPGEISYHAQLAAEYELLEVTMPILFPRFEATLVPEGVFALAERRGVNPGELVRDFDGTMKATAMRAMPAELRDALDRLASACEEGMSDLRKEAESFEKRLGAATDDASRRVRTALDKLRDEAARAARAAETKRDPAVKAYREYLRPRGVPQERVLSSLVLFLDARVDPLARLEATVDEHLVSTRERDPRHWLLPCCLRGGA